jgi:hypothetical protein
MNFASVATTNASSDEAPASGASRSRRAEKTRVQFDLSPRTLALLNELKERTESASYAEVFKNALKLYDGLITEAEKGGEFLIRDKDGKTSSLRIFL